MNRTRWGCLLSLYLGVCFFVACAESSGGEGAADGLPSGGDGGADVAGDVGQGDGSEGTPGDGSGGEGDALPDGEQDTGGEEGDGADSGQIGDGSADVELQDGTTADAADGVEDTLAEDASDAGESPEDAADGETSLDPATVPLRGICPMETRLGGFVVEAQEEFSIVDGKVADGVNPITVLEQVNQWEECRLLRKEFPLCDPPCQAGQTCDNDNQCIAFPKQQNLGTVTIEGLEELVVMEPKGASNSYFDTTLPHPVYAPGQAIHLTSTPGWAGAMEMFGVGSAMLELGETEWTIGEGSALSFSWNPAPEDARTHVHVVLNIDQHGLTPVVADCEFPDTGSATIPSTVIDALLGYGVSGFPNARVTRRTADSIEIAQGCIDFLVGSPRSPSVTITGHYPCTSTADCPPGLTCNVPIETCE